MMATNLFLAVKQEKLAEFRGNAADTVLLANNVATSGSFSQRGQIALYRDKEHIKKAVIYDNVNTKWSRIHEFQQGKILAFANEIVSQQALAILELQCTRMLRADQATADVARLIAEIRQEQKMINHKQEVIYHNMEHFLSK